MRHTTSKTSIRMKAMRCLCGALDCHACFPALQVKVTCGVCQKCVPLYVVEESFYSDLTGAIIYLCERCSVKERAELDVWLSSVESAQQTT
jgi:hypothetical protein